MLLYFAIICTQPCTVTSNCVSKELRILTEKWENGCIQTPFLVYKFTLKRRKIACPL